MEDAVFSTMTMFLQISIQLLLRAELGFVLCAASRCMTEAHLDFAWSS